MTAPAGERAITPGVAATLEATARNWSATKQRLPHYARLYAWDGYDEAGALAAWKRVAVSVDWLDHLQEQNAAAVSGITGARAAVARDMAAFSAGPDVVPAPVRVPLPPERMAVSAVVLAALALHVIEGEIPISDRHAMAVVRVCSPITDEAGLAEAWAEYVACVRVELDVEAGLLTWQQITGDGEKAGPDPVEDARQVARERSASALEVLTGRMP